jgi:hypothetical protein
MSNNTNWLAIAITEETYNNPEAMLRFKKALCIGCGYTEKCVDLIGDKLFSDIGLTRLETESGKIWYIAAPPLEQITGDAGAFAPARLQAAQAFMLEPTTILEGPCEQPKVIFESEGIIAKQLTP